MNAHFQLRFASNPNRAEKYMFTVMDCLSQATVKEKQVSTFPYRKMEPKIKPKNTDGAIESTVSDAKFTCTCLILQFDPFTH